MVKTMETKALQRIMIVDDSEIDRFVLRHLLRSLDYPGDIVSYASPREAMASIKDLIIKRDFKSLPNVIFLDLNMPEMSGFNFLDLFASFPEKATNNCKIIVTSAEDDLDNIQRSARYQNVIDFIIKPIHRIELEVKILLTGLQKQ